MENKIVIYETKDGNQVEVKLENNTVWATQQQIADLFNVNRQAITKHLKNIFSEGELDEDSVRSILEHTAKDGKTYKTGFYNLDAVISIGYRVNSVQATAFRRWATDVLKNLPSFDCSVLLLDYKPCSFFFLLEYLDISAPCRFCSSIVDGFMRLRSWALARLSSGVIWYPGFSPILGSPS